MNARKDELTTLLHIAEKLLALADIQAETTLADTRSRQRFRRETAEQLDRIEASVVRLKSSTPITEMSLGDAWTTAKKYGLWASTVILTVTHIVRSFVHF